MPPKKGSAIPRGSPKKKASPSHRTGPWVIGAWEKKGTSASEGIPPDPAPPIPETDGPPISEKRSGPTYDPDLFAINTPPSSRRSSRRSSPARSPQQFRGAEHLDGSAYDFHRLVRAKLTGTPPPSPGPIPQEGITDDMIREDAKARAATPPRTTATIIPRPRELPPPPWA